MKVNSKHPNDPTDSQRPQSRERRGRFSRKPEAVSFSRKGQESVLMAESTSPTQGLQRQKFKSQLQFFHPQRSQKTLKAPFAQEIKFMSPKIIKDCALSSSNDMIQSEKSPRFSRTSQWQHKKAIDSSIIDKLNGDDSETNFTPKVSHISLESVFQKENMDTSPSSRDWSAIQRQNSELREENKRLKEQNSKHLKKIKTFSDQESRPYGKNSRTGKCKNCISMDDEIKLQGKYLKLFEATITSKQKQLQNMKIELVEARLEIELESEKYIEAVDQLKLLARKNRDGQEKNEELQRIILSLKKKLQNSQQQKRSLGIQQNILLKKKQESEHYKVEVAKLTTQKQNLKELIATYKTRLDIIRVLNQQKKLKKSKSSKGFDNSDIFDLSSEQSDCNQ